MLRVRSAGVGMVVLTGVARSAVLTVDPTLRGLLGSDSGSISGNAMVPFAVPDAAMFEISATGTLCLVPDFACTAALFVGSPDGITIASAGTSLPIEEKTGINLDPNLNAGALMGA